MRPALKQIKHLEAFLQGQLHEEEELDVEVRLLWDREWEQQVEQQRLSYAAIREAGRKQLRQELRGIHQRLFG